MKLNGGNLTKAVRFLTDRKGGKVLLPDDIDEKSGNTVKKALFQKHPKLRSLDADALHDYKSTPALQSVTITEDVVEKVAGKLSGSAGLVNFDSMAMRNLLLQHGSASKKLRNAFAKFATWLANDDVPWAAIRGLLMCREVALDKMPGIRPIGIGDIIRRFIAKCVLLVAGLQATDACGSDQLCAGLKLGCEGAVHGINALWNDLSAGERHGFLLIDADNGFNEFSRIQMLWTCRHEWPQGARFAFNLYRHQSLLLVRDPGGKPFVLFSKEGCTQGCPLAMVLYALGTLPMIRKLKATHPSVFQPWYADDAGAMGKFEDILAMYKHMTDMGRNYGYIPNASKCILVVPDGRKEEADQFFNQLHHLNFTITTGARYLGGFVGSKSACNDYVSAKVEGWIDGVERLAMVANKNEPHAAYTGLTKSLLHQWTYLQRVIADSGPLFEKLESAIATKFIPAIFGEATELDDTIRGITALPTKYCGIGLPNPVTNSTVNYETSTLALSHLSAAIQGKIPFHLVDHETVCTTSRSAYIARRKDLNEIALSDLLDALPLTDGKALIRRTINRGRHTGIWLSTIPSNLNGNFLGKQEWEDAIRMRYGLTPLNLPEFCDGCGKKFTFDHAMNCKHGGVIHRRHDALKYELMNIAAMATRESAVGAEPLINPGSLTALRSNSDSNNDTVSSEDRGDIIVRSLWGNQHDGIIDVRLTNTDAPGYGNRDPMKVLQSAAKSKKTKYLDACFQQRRSFTPFVVSTDGMLEKEAKALLKTLSMMLAEKWQKPYSVVAGIVRSKIGIAIVRATNQCLRSPRIGFRSMSKRIDWNWDDGGGTNLYRISNQHF